ncbi:hypothetical protein [Aureimonas pseudogalii]|uniref:Uncharacterized protein n=1 Tax=Aureimonas pseudogalii TaxID=1744844 RepID=A0A7W6H7Q0_9HYPH|nr:hypothetical protein [Aureimonas pseudogalii]MBB4000114.1 hypothetical protein [Aureimonas pseudogalii]
MRSFRRLALCGFSLLAIVASASAGTIVPVNDDPPMAGFPEGAVLDVLGIKLGMTPDDVRAAYDGELSEEKRTIREVNPDTGASFDVQYVYQLTTKLPPRSYGAPIKAENVLEVTFGSPFVANRAVRISNTYRPPSDTPISPQGFMTLLEKKYGATSGVYKRDNRSLWVFGPDGRVVFDRMPEAYDRTNDRAGYEIPNRHNYTFGPMPMCLRASEFEVFKKSSLPYAFDAARKIETDGCVGGIVAYPGDRADTSPRVVIAVDQRRVDLDNAALDAAVKTAHTAPLSNIMEPKL